MAVVKRESNSCYIHIPFCNNICTYCDFCKVLYNSNFTKKYLAKLSEEIEATYQKEALKTIYIGGGTPSSLNIEELEMLFEIISCLKKDTAYEFTIECNFDSITSEKLALFKKYGVNRLSFGIETTNPLSLQKLNRSLDLKAVRKIITSARELGFNNINVDLMYAFPFADITILKKDLDFILSLKVEHISTYSLMISPHTQFYIDDLKPISEEEDLEMYNYIHTVLTKQGYEHYEVSNFAKKGYQSKHNLTYWHNERYYGFGLGASSYINNIRSTNTMSLTNYLKGNNTKTNEEINTLDEMSYELILGLRLNTGVNLNHFKQKFGCELATVFPYQDLLKDKKIVCSHNNLMIPFEKWYIMNNILINFMR